MADSLDFNYDDGNETNCSQFPNEYCDCGSTEDYLNCLVQAYIYPDPYEWALIAAHIIVFIVGLVGNALVCVAVFRNTSIRTVTNYFIVNLAVADFLVILICLPPTVIWDVTNTWFLGEALCKIVLYFQTVSISVSVLTLTVISVERWYAICYPLKFKATTSRAKRLVLLIWAIALIVDIPELIVLETSTPIRNVTTIIFTTCAPNWDVELDIAYIIIRSLILYAAPLMFMSVAYYQIVKVLWSTETIPGDRSEAPIVVPTSNGNHLNGVTNHNGNGRCNAQLLTPVLRGASTFHCSQADYQLKSRRKAAKMLVAVVIMFALCYLPVHFYSVFTYVSYLHVLPLLRAVLSPHVIQKLTGIKVNNDFLTYFAMISHWLCYANSAINPVIYNFMSGKFRREFARAFQCICSKNSYSPATSRVYTYNIHRRQARQITGGSANGGRIWC